MSADEIARVVIERKGRAEDPDGFDVDVQTEGVDSEDSLALLLLVVVQKITGVRTDTYVSLVDECRRVAARETGETWKAMAR